VPGQVACCATAATGPVAPPLLTSAAAAAAAAAATTTSAVLAGVVLMRAHCSTLRSLYGSSTAAGSILLPMLVAAPGALVLSCHAVLAAGAHYVCANMPTRQLTLLDTAIFFTAVCRHCSRLCSASFCTCCCVVSCSYDYDEVSFLLEVYGHLEEPDGIAGGSCGGALGYLQWLLGGWGLSMLRNAYMQTEPCLYA
jgi:hypothetical protein